MVQPSKRPRLGVDDLPGEALLQVFGGLCARDRARAEAACKAWRELAALPAVWGAVQAGVPLDGTAHSAAALRFLRARGAAATSLTYLPEHSPAHQEATGELALAPSQHPPCRGGALTPLLQCFPALRELHLANINVASLDFGHLAAALPQLQRLHISEARPDLARGGWERALPAGHFTPLGRLTALEALGLSLGWAVTHDLEGGWSRGLLGPIERLTRLTALQLLNHTDQVPSFREGDGRFGAGLGRLARLQQLTDSACCGLPPSPAALPALTALSLLDFDWGEQGAVLWRCRHLRRLRLYSPTPEPEACSAPGSPVHEELEGEPAPPDESVYYYGGPELDEDACPGFDAESVRRTLAGVTNLFWGVRAPGLAGLGPLELPTLQKLELSGAAAFFAQLRWGAGSGLRRLRVLDNLTPDRVDLGSIACLTSLTKLEVSYMREPAAPLRLPAGPYLARLRRVLLTNVGLERVPVELQGARRLTWLCLSENFPLRITPACVSTLTALGQRLSYLSLCKGWQPCPVTGGCAWDDESACNLRLLVCRLPPGVLRAGFLGWQGSTCGGCHGAARL